MPDKTPSQDQLAHLLQRLAGGDVEALAPIYDAVAPWLLSYLHTLTHSREDAEECLQEVFVRLVHSRKRLKTVQKARPYLLAIARNEAFRRIRRRSKQADTAHGNEMLLLVKAHGDSSASTDLAESVSRALSLLPTAQREVVVLRAYQALSFEEIADLTRVPVQTAASRYRYALQKIEAFLREQGYA